MAPRGVLLGWCTCRNNQPLVCSKISDTAKEPRRCARQSPATRAQRFHLEFVSVRIVEQSSSSSIVIVVILVIVILVIVILVVVLVVKVNRSNKE